MTPSFRSEFTPTSNMELPASAKLLIEIDSRQDEILRQLDALNQELERALAGCQRELRVVGITAEAA